MPSATVTRFQIAMLLALALGALALAWRSTLLLGGVTAAFLTVVGLGVWLPQWSLFGPYICRGTEDRRRVALTFDDGPDARSTPALLDLLREARVTASFFCVGRRVAAQEELAARMVREGHLLENHSYSHSYATNLFTVARLETELARTQAAIEKATGIAPTLFRPPMGLSNPRVFHVARTLGLKVIGWTARGFDTQRTDPDRIVARIVRQLRPGAIILLHDGGIPAERLVATVKALLASLRQQEYEVVRLDQLLSK